MNYARMPGPGDLPGDSHNSNSPDYVEPLYGEEEAEDDVAKALIKNDEVGEVVGIMRAMLPLLRCIKDGREIPQSYRSAALVALDKAVALQRMVDEHMVRHESAAEPESAPDLDSDDYFDRKFASIFGLRRAP